ncbi:MAG: LacI family DNA-binding transcriptional regulator [Opitutus sp.]
MVQPHKTKKESRTGAPTGTVGDVPRSDSPARPAKKPTIYDLARIAEVSPGTVSRVLNNRDKVKPETRERVLRAANALNLKPQVSVRFRQVAILSEPTFHDRIEGYAATMTAHLSFALSRRNIGVVLPSNPFEQLPGLFLDGLIAVTFDKQLQALLAELETRMHVVYMDKFDVAPREYAVCSDHYNSGVVAAQHFLARGKRRLGFLASHNNAPFVERLKGFRKALADANVPADERLHVFIGPSTNHLSAITRIVRAGADCIYVPGTSYQAMECLHILTYVMGVKVPQEISIIGGENEGISALQNPPLTTIEEPLRDMADQAAAMLDQLTSGARVANRHTMMPVRLIERDSVG